jgi:hypothetical protein
VDELVRVEDTVVPPGADPWGSSGLRVADVGAVPARTIYAADAWCEPGARIRLLFADQIDGVLTPAIETALACDGLIHELSLPLPLPNGSPVYVAADPATHWSVRVVSATPPIALADNIAGWQPAGGIGPSLHFETTEVSFSDVAGESGGPLMVVLDCAGPVQDIEVDVDRTGILGDAFETRRAACTPDGSRRSFTFDTGPTGYIVRHAAPAGTWTALSLLIPEATPGP